MKLLDKLVLRELFPAFRLGVALFTVLVLAGGPLLEASKYLAEGVPPRIVLTVLVLRLPWVLGLTLPIGMLLAMLLGFGRLAADSEAMALFAAGIPVVRLVVPAAVLGLAVSLGGYVLNDHIAAVANRRVAALQERVLHEPGQTTRAINWEERRDGVLVAMVHVEKGFDLATNSLHQILITLYEGPGSRPSAVIYAETGQWLGGEKWRLMNVDMIHPAQHGGYMHADQLRSDALKSSALKSSVLEKTPEEIAFLGSNVNTFDFQQLYLRIAQLRAKGMGASSQVREAEVELWSKLAWPLSSLVFVLIGAPLGLRAQRTSKNTGWLLSVSILFGYYVLYMVMRSVADGGYCPAALAVFVPNLIGTSGGVYLIRQAPS